MDTLFADLGLQVLERGWLSSNAIVFSPGQSAPPTVVDTGYDSHAQQTVDLLLAASRGRPVERIVNTHLHADHCGGNRLLQDLWDCETCVPAASSDVVRRWDEDELTYRATGQRCRRFRADTALEPGQTLALGAASWRTLPAPGHDPNALMLFQPDSRVLISADALWEARLAIIFPELAGADGFSGARAVLDAIEALAPSVVIPGHGAPFTDVSSALQRSRQRLAAFAAEPRRHRRYAERALTMFHMLEHRTRAVGAVVQWLQTSPVFASAAPDAGRVIDELVAERLLQRQGDRLSVAERARHP